MHIRPYALPFLLFPSVSVADVTPQDVWDNMVAGYAAVGIDLSGTLDRAGDTLTVNDAVANVVFPVVGGGISATLPAMTLTDQGDGTVSIGTPQTYLSAITIQVPEEPEQISADLTIANGEISSIAAGDPGDVTYTTVVRDFDMLISNVVVPNEFGEGALTGQFESEGYDSVTRITVADTVTITNEATNLPSVFSFNLDDGELVQESTGEGGVLKTSLMMAIPPETSIMNLSPALGNGLSIKLATENEGSTTQTITRLNGDEFSSQRQVTKASQSTFELDAAGLRTEGQSEGGTFDMNAGGFMPPISLDFGPIAGAFAFPVLGASTPQPYKLELSISDLKVADNLWNMIDPGSTLDRSPASVSFGFKGEITSEADIFSPETMAMLDATGVIPVEPNTLEIYDVLIAALGATVSAEGKFTFDNTDLETFGGLPRPEGMASARAVGLNAAIDQLIAAGLITEQDIGMGRMFMGMFAVQQGDDDLTTELEVNGEGHVILNGQRIQ